MNFTTERMELAILGGGPAGLAAAYYARKAGMDCTVLEAGATTGGNCRTLRHGDFLFDTGAHRLHDKDPEVTAELRTLLGEDLLRVEAPSQIYYNRRFVDFPLSPYDVLTTLDRRTLLSIAREQLERFVRRRIPAEHFRAFAVAAYGPTLARLFLLNYSEKLWGRPAEQLSPAVAGQRLKGLDLRSFVLEALYGKRRRTEHLDGVFYYPKNGIGMIFDRVAEVVGSQFIRTGCRITGLRHNGREITSIEINGTTTVAARTVVSSLPLPLFVRLLSPAPPASVLDIAQTMTFRCVVLCVLMLRRDRWTANASVYFPGPQFPFTRIYESKNRSRSMAPEGMTSLVVELPCFREDSLWTMDAAAVRDMVVAALAGEGLLQPDEVVDSVVTGIPFAYPVLETGFEERAARLIDYCGRFGNLAITGRSGRYQYLHIHDMFRSGREVIAALQQQRPQ